MRWSACSRTSSSARGSSDRESLLDAAMAAHVNAMGSLWRAVSLLDIALADAVARRAGRPLWQELGGSRARVPLMVVAGYHASERGADAVVAEVRALLDAGFRSVKLHTTDLTVISRVRAVCGDDVPLGVDVGMTGTDAAPMRSSGAGRSTTWGSPSSRTRSRPTAGG